MSLCQRPLGITGLFLSLSIFSGFMPPAYSQDGLPLPGETGAQTAPVFAPPSQPTVSPLTSTPAITPAATPTFAPAVGQAPHSARNGINYRDLPLSTVDARRKLDELKNLIQGSTSPQAVQQSVIQLCEWLQDMADAHYKMYLAFNKQDGTKAQAQNEKQAATKFSEQKNEAQLLKADLLIKEHRYPEALGPLVNIVVQEPASATGQAAYQRLKEIGFAEDLPFVAAPAAHPSSAIVPNKESKPQAAITKSSAKSAANLKPISLNPKGQGRIVLRSQTPRFAAGRLEASGKPRSRLALGDGRANKGAKARR